MITIKYFGAIAEKAKTEGEAFPFSNQSLQDVINTLDQKHELSTLSYSIAVNQKIIQDTKSYLLESNDIVALLPPFAGG
ncbi:MoaD/ThiS family protein [Flavobacterium sp. WC2430]|uniref:MoaD/ThiS family protein n=1 Tax=Flavobacterium sp. WC2430 TaxID=3234137 RepID=UPI003467B88C